MIKEKDNKERFMKNMQLREYLFFERITVSAFARLLDVSTNHLSGVVNGRYPISRKLAKKIYRLTGGRVDFREDRDKL